MKKCPKCGHDEFYTNAHVIQGWMVDENGDYTVTTKECVEVTHAPDKDDIWKCVKCGFSAAGSEFEVE